jgi:uncharacterized lipoprotein YehR (DUF1307 family)
MQRISRKHCILALTAIALVAALAISLPGCQSSNESKAKEYIQNAEEVQETSYDPDEVEKQSEEVFTGIATAAQSGTPLDSSTIEKAEDLLFKMDEGIERMNKAKTEYQKVKDLSDVEAYKEYADLEIQSIELYEQFSAPMIDIVDYSVANMGSSGFNGEEVLQKLQAFLENYSSDTGKLSEMENEIDELRKKLGL